MKTSDQKKVALNLLNPALGVYANPMILALSRKIKRAEAGQWFQEIQKLLNGFYKSFEGIEALMNKFSTKTPIKIDEKEIYLSQEQLHENLTYMLDNAILRLFAGLDKIAQLVRVFLEEPANGGLLRTKVCWKCSHPECKNVEMKEGNSTFTSICSFLNKNKRESQVVDEILRLYDNESINKLRPFRSGFAHRKNIIDQSVGIAPDVDVEIDENKGIVKGTLTFPTIPEYNWFRVELVNSYNAIINFLNICGPIIFPPDIQLKIEHKGPKQAGKRM